MGSRGKKLDFEVDSNGCFICTSHTAQRSDRGRKRIVICKEGKNVFLHRWIYIQMFGDIPEGQVLRHKCDNSQCINPEHFELGTQKQNVWDMIERGRFKGYTPRIVDNVDKLKGGI